MVWLTDSENILKIYYSFWQNVWMWQTDGQTDGHRMMAALA